MIIYAQITQDNKLGCISTENHLTNGISIDVTEDIFNDIMNEPNKRYEYDETTHTLIWVNEPEYISYLQVQEIKNVEQVIQRLLDSTARLHQYDSILSACSYAGYPNTFQQESIDFGNWRSNVWNYCYQELDKVKNGLRPKPSIEEFLLELPQFTAS